MKQLFGSTINILEQAINLRSLRNTLITANIANVDTPGYRPTDIPFQELMSRYMEDASAPSGLARTDEAHFNTDGRSGSGTTGSHGPIDQASDAVTEPSERGTPNSVDIDVEMTRLATNNLQYQAAVQALIKEFELLKTAITEGGKT